MLDKSSPLDSMQYGSIIREKNRRFVLINELFLLEGAYLIIKSIW